MAEVSSLPAAYIGGMDAAQPNGIDLTPAGATRSVPGLGVVRFRTLSIGISFDLYERYFCRPTRVDYRAFVSTLIAEMAVDPQLSPDEVHDLNERVRGSLRLGIADAAGVLSQYRSLKGTALSGDERLFAVLLEAHRRLGETTIAGIEKLSRSIPNFTRMLPPTLPRIDRSVERLDNLLRFPTVDPTASLRRMQTSVDATERLFTGPRIVPTKRLVDIKARGASTGQAQPLRDLMRSPAIDVVKKAQDDIGVRTAALDAIARSQIALGTPTSAAIAEMLEQTQKAITSAVRPFALDFARRNEETIRRMLHSPAATKALKQTQAHLVEVVASPFVESVLGLGRKLGIQVGRGLVRGVEEAARLFDENWAYFQGDPRHPKPVLFVIASLPGAIGLPLYHSIKERHDEQLIGLLEPVLINPELVEEIKSAIVGAPLLHPVARQQMCKALDSVREGEYAEACPQLYTSLEGGFYAAAEAAGVIDWRSRFLPAADTVKSKARKVDDLFEHLPLEPRYKRFLRSWIFAEEGARFRHGRVSDPEECRRQALLLTMAILGWLELFGDWEQHGFRRLLRSEASSRARLPVPIGADAA